jgi:serine/threonine protein kinase
MASAHSDRNLLVGVLALQIDLISQTQLIAALQAWMLQKHELLEKVMQDQGMIGDSQRRFLADIAQRHLELHNNQIQESLASLSTIGSAKEALLALDQEFEQTLSHASELRQQLTAQPQSPETTFYLSTPSDGANAQTRFRILRPHAKGGLGIVSIAEDTELHREVAVKQLQDHVRDETSRARFLQEAEITGRLEHPGIVPVYSLGSTTDGEPFYVMRFIRGNSLRDAIQSLHDRRPPQGNANEYRLSLRKLVQRLIDVCNAIEYAHSRGVLHRDIKPGNIMLGRYGETLVVDWGLAKPMGFRAGESTDEGTVIPSSGDGSHNTHMGTLVGTLAYMSPEQAAGALSTLGPHSDVYCLGATLYSILTGRPPIPKGETSEMRTAIQQGRITPIRQINPMVDPALEAICRKAMALQVTDRYATAGELCDDLERWLADEPVAVYPEPWSRKFNRWVRDNQTWAAAFAVLILSALLFSGVIALLISRQNRDLKIANTIKTIAERSARESLAKTEAAERIASDRYKLFSETAINMISTLERQVSKDQAMRKEIESTIDNAYNEFKNVYLESPKNPVYARGFAYASRYSANRKYLNQEITEAANRIGDAIEVLEQGLSQQQLDETQRVWLAESYRDAFSIYRAADDLQAAHNALLRAEEILQQPFTTISPANIEREIAWIVEKQTISYSDLWQLEDANRTAEKSIEFFKKQLESDQAHPEDQRLLIISLYRRGRALHFLNRKAESQAAYDAAIEEVNKSRERSGGATYLPEFTRILTWSAEALADHDDRLDLAQERIRNAIALLTPRAANSKPFQFYLAEALEVYGKVLLQSGQLDAAVENLSHSQAILNKLISTDDKSYYNFCLGDVLALLAECQLANGQSELANSTRELAYAAKKKAVQQVPQNGEYQQSLKKLEESFQSR